MYFTLYDWGLLAFIPTAILGIYYDLKVRGAPFKIFIPSAIGMVICVYYILSVLPELWFYVALQITVVSAIAVIMYMMRLAGNDDMLYMITLSGIFLGVGFIIVAGTIITMSHLIFRRVTHRRDNPYKSRYNYYPYPAVAYFGITFLLYFVLTYIFFISGAAACGQLCGPQWF